MATMFDELLANPQLLAMLQGQMGRAGVPPTALGGQGQGQGLPQAFGGGAPAGGLMQGLLPGILGSLIGGQGAATPTAPATPTLPNLPAQAANASPPAGGLANLAQGLQGAGPQLPQTPLPPVAAPPQQIGIPASPVTPALSGGGGFLGSLIGGPGGVR